MINKPYFNIEIQPDLAVILTANPESKEGKALMQRIREWPDKHARTLLWEEDLAKTPLDLRFRSGYERLQLLEDTRSLITHGANYDPKITTDTEIKPLAKVVKKQKLSLELDAEVEYEDVEVTFGLELRVAEKKAMDEFVPLYRIYTDGTKGVKVETVLYIPKRSDFAPKVLDTLLLTRPRNYDKQAEWERPVSLEGENGLRIALPHLKGILDRIGTYNARVWKNFDALREAERKIPEEYQSALLQYVANLSRK